ncbi:MAG: ParA family protein [Spirochaetaceae bacterium]|jgi:chromosome partitioning protein|nr:ParA family protein [Spirochaetaceae bacterium]
MKTINEKRTTVVSFASIKGGVGKTHIAILLADYLAARGKRVALIDSDLNNSLSYHYLDKEMLEKTRKQNFAAALGDENNNLCDFAVPTRTAGVDLIASSPYLADMRTLNERRLKRLVPTLYGTYDILIIDCHPTYDNIVLNALHAADYAITPVLKDLFSYNAAVYFSEVLPRDVEGLANWFVLPNGYDKQREDAKSGRQRDFIKLYKDHGLPLTPASTWLPWTARIHQIVDYNKRLTGVDGVSGGVYHPALHGAVAELAGCFFDSGLEMAEAV